MTPTLKTFKHGSGNIMFWGSFSANIIKSLHHTEEKKMEKSWIRMSFTQPGHWKCIVGGPSHKTMIQNILQSQKLKKTPAKDETESWSFVSPNHNLKALRISTRSAKISAWQRLLYQVVNLSSSYFSLWNSH